VYTTAAVAAAACLCRTHFAKIFENEQQSQNLAQIRDNLLPKLMNGEIEV
jgi:hypothetical protein